MSRIGWQLRLPCERTETGAKMKGAKKHEIHFDDEHHADRPGRSRLAQRGPPGARGVYEELLQRTSGIRRVGVSRGAGLSGPGETGARRQGWDPDHRRHIS